MWQGGSPETETGYVRTESGVRLFYRRMGGDGLPVLLLHGWPETGHAWRRVMPTLATSGYTVVAPDLRGAGLSDKPTGGYDALTRMEDVRTILRTLDLADAPLFVVGHGDDGAMAAQTYVVAHRDEVAGLALISPPGVFFTPPTLLNHWHFHFHQAPDLPELLIEPQLASYLRYFFSSWSHDPHMLSNTDLAVYVEALSQPGALRASLAPFRSAREGHEYLQRSLKTPLDTPVLLVTGESDPRANLDYLEADWHCATRDLHVETISRGGYWLPEERPDAVATALLTFFQQVREAGQA